MGAPDMLVTDRPLVAQLVMTPALADDLRREAGALEEAQNYVIDSAPMAQLVNAQLQDVKRRIAVVEGWYERFTDPLKALKQTADSFFGPPRTNLAAAEAHYKGLLLGWERSERERVEREQQLAREARIKAEAEARQKAEAERARAAQAAEADKRRAEEAERKRQEEEAAAARARAEGDKSAAAAAERRAQAAAAERAKAEESARTRAQEGERRANEIELEASARADTAVVVPTTKLAGFSSRPKWVIELDPTCPDVAAATVKVVEAIAGVPLTGRLELFALLSLDMSAARDMAKALKSNFNVPGLRAKDDRTAQSRQARG